MSIERLSGQGYAPIPQSMSNTDTEDEDERLAVTNVIGHDNVGCAMRDNAEAQGNGWCHGTNDERNFGKDAGDGQGGYRYCGDDVPIMVPEVETQDDFWKRRDMSLLRRCCLVFSIFLCFATVLVFLYVLPCDNSAICPPIVDKQPVIAWDKTLEGIELHGPISVVHGSPYSLIFLLRGQRFGVNTTNTPESRQIPRDGGGVLSMQGNTGTPLWWVPLGKMPSDIDCASFDSDGSGAPDCIVIGRDLLVSIDPTAGISHWNTPIATDSRLPLRVPDVDADGIDDLMLAKAFGSPREGLAILSGKTGKTVSQFIDQDCIRRSMRLNGFISGDNVSYSCEKKDFDGTTKTANQTVSLSKFVEAEKDIPALKQEDASDVGAFEGKSLPVTSRNFDSFATQLTPYYQLSVENSGPCPGENCRTRVNVTLQKAGSDDRVIWDHASNNSYAMRPAIFPKSDNPYVTGFAVKFWQWDDTMEIVGSGEGDEIVKRRLTEKILMVFVNYTDVHERNPSQEEIIQLCRGDDCQPSLKLQTRSIAIADLGDDGTWELIHYQSSYSPKNQWLLTSRVQIVKLDTVIAQLTPTSVN